jgi:LL-diaminopimelate aminotransferase
LSGLTFLFDLLDQAGVLVNAGSSFGSQGARYVRLALVRNDQEVEEAAKRILQSKIMEKPSN